jgi:hypothetical protein
MYAQQVRFLSKLALLVATATLILGIASLAEAQQRFNTPDAAVEALVAAARALYAVTDMEYPRLGLIRIESFDHFLVDAHQQMQGRDMSGTVGSGRTVVIPSPD